MNDHPSNESAKAPPYRIGEWHVDPLAGHLAHNNVTRKLGPRAMDVLTYLAERANTTVTHNELLDRFWRGSLTSTNAIHKCITDLRRAFNGSPEAQAHIETVPKRGYRLVAKVDQRDPAAASVGEGGTILRVRSRSALIRRPESADRQDLAEIIYRDLKARFGQISHVSTAELKRLADPISVNYVIEVDIHEDAETCFAAIVVSPITTDLPAHRVEFQLARVHAFSVLGKSVSRAVDDMLILLDDEDLQRMRERGTKNVEAYRLAREAEELRRDCNVPTYERAADLLTRAIASDPNFGFAYELQANIHYDLWHQAADARKSEAVRRVVKALLEKSRMAQLEPKYIECVEQTYRTISLTSSNDAERYWREELIRNPRNGEALRRYGDLLLGAGLADEDQRFVECAIECDAANREIYEIDYAQICEVRGHVEECLKSLKRTLDRFGDFTVALFGIVQTLAKHGRYQEAELYLARLEAADESGSWAYAAWLRLQAVKGDLPLGSEKLEIALADSRATNIIRGYTYLTVGDVPRGVASWRQIEPHFLELIWRSRAQMETFYPRHVLRDARYQGLLEELGVGESWTSLLRARVAELDLLVGARPKVSDGIS